VVRLAPESIVPTTTSSPPPIAELEGQGPVIGFVGRLAPEKGVSCLVEAMGKVVKSHPEARLAIVGDGEERPHLEALSESLGISARVFFLGSQDNLPSCIAAMDIVVLPSLSEGFGLAAVEAMSAGRPVVASAVGGLVEIIKDGATGFLVPPNDPDALAARLTTILSDPDLAAELGSAGQKRVQEWSAEEGVNNTEAWYLSATESNQTK
jgi:glycosyltransferase involved in cell wall biosynthesis